MFVSYLDLHCSMGDAKLHIIRKEDFSFMAVLGKFVMTHGNESPEVEGYVDDKQAA